MGGAMQYCCGRGSLAETSPAGSMIAAVILLTAANAFAQLPFPPSWANGPVGSYSQEAYPYPGQCWTSQRINGLPACTLRNAKSFACEPSGSGKSNQSAASRSCGAVSVAKLVNPMSPDHQQKFQWEVLNPPDYTPDTTSYPGVDYYEIGIHEAWGFQALADAGLFPNAKAPPDGVTPIAQGAPDGTQWTGLVCPANARDLGLGCSPRSPLFTPVWGIGQINKSGGPLTTALRDTGLFAEPQGRQPSWSANDYIATWPSISIRGSRGRPVRVKWVNELPNNHLFCPHPEAADWPCAIDRTFMGVKPTIDAQKAPPTFNVVSGVVPFALNQFGSPMQPDNSFVAHLHGGNIPPAYDGFSEKWFGNRQTGALYSPVPWPLDPAFGAPYTALASGDVVSPLKRPGGPDGDGRPNSWYFDTYTFPMVNHEATLWFHDHALGKTHHTVIAGPAGFFPVEEEARHQPIVDGVCQTSEDPLACEYTWLDPITAPRDSHGAPKYDLFLAIQDRTFSDDGTINFSNGIGQPQIPPATRGAAGYPDCLASLDSQGNPAPTCSAPGTSPWTNGPNPEVHPTWVPEYFGDHALVNGVLWPKRTVAPGWYRVRLVNGADARCFTLGLGTVEPGYATASAAAAEPVWNVPFTVIANEQGYLPAPITNLTHFDLCPGERLELLVNFGGQSEAYTDPVTQKKVLAAPLKGRKVYMSNTASAPFPDGITPQQAGSPYAHLASIMRFDVLPACRDDLHAVPTCAAGRGATWPGDEKRKPVACLALPAQTDPDFAPITKLADCPRDPGGHPIVTGAPCIAAERQLYLNERVDPLTQASLGMQINGMPFEHGITETPKVGTYERWRIINATVDAHPIHPHLVRAQVVSRQGFARGEWLKVLCGSPACQPSAAPNVAPLLAPDVTPFLTGSPVPPTADEAGWKDVMRAMPGEVLTFVARWDGDWKGARGECRPDDVTCFEPVTAGPYLWHCHINSHEDSEMMRASMVVR